MESSARAPLVPTAGVLVALAMVTAPLSGCGDVETTTYGPVASPTRTAAEDASLRRMAMDVAASRACDALSDRLLPLPENRVDRPAGVLPLAEGRLWVRGCETRRDGDRLAVALSGRGWQWVEQSRPGPLGSSFSVRGTVRFEAALSFTAELDLRYDVENHLALVMLTPVAPPSARVTPIGTVPIEPDGGWSGLIAGLGGLLGMDAQAQARQMLEAEAASTLQRELSRGLTLSLDLCSGQLDGVLGALADGERPPSRPYDDDGRRWMENAHGRLRAGGLDLSGPWEGEGMLRVDVAIERGSSLDVALLCGDEATELLGRYLATGDGALSAPALAERTATGAASTSLLVAPARCAAPYVHLRTDDPLVRYRIRVRREEEASEAWVDCE